MRQLTLILLFISSNLFSQNPIWFETGTTWIYNYYGSGPITTQNFTATFIASEQVTFLEQECTKIEVTENGNQTIFPTPFPCMSIQPPYYVYESNDSIYYTNENDDSFKLAYDFGASVGDTWEFVVPVELQDEILGRDTLLVTVLSTGTINVNGNPLREMILEYENISNNPHSTVVHNEITVTEFLGADQVFMIPFPQAGWEIVCDGEFNTFLQCYDGGTLSYTNPEFSSCTLGIDDYSLDNTIHMYPNPASESFVIESTSYIKGVIQISTVLGEVIMIQQLSGKIQNMNTTNLTPGIYLVNIETVGGDRITKKLFVI